MRCRNYNDPRFFLANGTMRLDIEPEAVFDTLAEYVTWLNRDAFDGWRFVPPAEVQTVRQCAQYLDAMVSDELQQHGFDEPLTEAEWEYGVAA